MRLSKQIRRDAKALFRGCQVDGLLDERRVREAVRQVIDRKPRRYVALLSRFSRLVRLDLARRTGVVESAVVLGADLESGIRARLTQQYGAGLDLSFATQPELIGGMRVQVGSDVFDGSVLGRLAELQDSF